MFLLAFLFFSFSKSSFDFLLTIISFCILIEIQNNLPQKSWFLSIQENSLIFFLLKYSYLFLVKIL